MKDYAITLKNEDGAHFGISCDEVKYYRNTRSFYFITNKTIISWVAKKDVYEIADISGEEYKKIDLETIEEYKEIKL